MSRSFAVEVEGALRKGFNAENISQIVRFLNDARLEPRTANRITLYTVQSVLAHVHSHWLERQPFAAATGIVLEARLVPPIVAVLRATDEQPAELLAALNALVRALDSALSEVPSNPSAS